MLDELIEDLRYGGMDRGAEIADIIQHQQAELAELRAFKAACEEQEAVGWVDREKLKSSMAYATAFKATESQSPLYLHPAPEAAQLRIKAEEMESAFVQCSTVLDGAERWIAELEAQLAKLTEQRDLAVEALFIASETFREYAGIHAAKTPPDLKKAEFNGFRAQQMIDALKAIKSSEVKE
jgi:hypothetical protein